MEIRQGDIFNKGIGEYNPVLVISNDIMNKNSSVVIILGITSKIKETRLPSHVFLKAEDYNLREDSILLGEQVHTIDRNFLKEKIGRVDEEVMKKVAQAYAFNTFMDVNFFRKVNVSTIDFILGEKVPFSEDYDNEFKEIWHKKTYEQIHQQIRDTSIEYVCSFLNNGGGRLLFGIRDDGTVLGFKLLPEQRDKLSQAVNNAIKDSIHPKLTTLNFRLVFHQVIERDSDELYELEDVYVLEVMVYPPLDPSTVYYEGAYKIWTKLNGQNRVLENTEITDFIIRKALVKK